MEREVGRGGMATVYQAEDVRHRRSVALKVLLPELAVAIGPERFLREIGIAARLQHPHILPLYDSGEVEGCLYYVMPFVEGESLRDRLAKEGRLPLEEAVRIAREVADGLAYAHERGVVHRDIKPENILLSAGHVVIADFGIARAVDAAGGTAITHTGMVMGTPAYMSPEQSFGECTVDQRSDIYSLACVLYEMLASEPPFAAPTAQAMIAQRVSSPAPHITAVMPAVPASLDDVLARALATDAADRYSAAAEFGDALVDAIGAGVRPGRSAPGTPSVAVLPFTSMSADPENEYFSEGITEEIINVLARIGGLRVAARSSSFAFKDKGLDIPTLARKLGVATVLEGSVRRAGNR
ncbi:MAG: protein kinase, partial [Gemmatimonadetes bacterium]|nr:protein kinase [Gemmatimonadota bacterium]